MTRIRIFAPFYPWPKTEGAFSVMANQIEALAQQGHEVELCLTKETPQSLWRRQKAAHSLQEPQAPDVRARTACTALALAAPPSLTPRNSKTQKAWEKSLRVLRSLFSRFASPELYFYPTNFITGTQQRRQPPTPTTPTLTPFREVDWEIYHYSFAYAWLFRRPVATPSLPLPLTLTPLPPAANATTAASLAARPRCAVFLHNLESDLALLQGQATRTAWMRPLYRHNARKLRLHEDELRLLVDELWFISPADLQRYSARNPDVTLRQAQGKLTLRLIPPHYPESLRARRLLTPPRPTPDLVTTNDPLAARLILGWIGDLGFLPNQESALWILTQLAPLLQTAGFQGQILFLGKNASPQLLEQAQAYPFVRFLGFQIDAEPFWSQLSYLLVPHLHGSGVRTKLLEALASGVPVITHPEALAQVHPDLAHSPLLVAKTVAPDWIQELFSQPPLAKRLQLQTLPFPVTLTGDHGYPFLTTPTPPQTPP